MSSPTDGMQYYMPLTKGSPKDGPATSVFSVPKVQYSSQTEAVVKNLMRESRLTFTQKHVFDTILRNGKSLPEHPDQMMNSFRQAYMKQRHRNKARLVGMQLLDLEDSYRPPRMFPNYVLTTAIRSGRSAPARRSLDVIKASGDLEPTAPPRCCMQVSKESEKERLAHKMAFGKEPIDPAIHALEKQTKELAKQAARSKTIDDMKEERYEELIDEIQDRMQFLQTMDKVNKGKDYQSDIVNQINEKLHEMRKISPQKEKDVRDCLQLELLDKRLGSSFANEQRTSKFFE